MNYGEFLRDNEALRSRFFRLSQARRCITADLEPNAVLQGVVDGTRSLTRASTAGRTALDERGQLWEFVTAGLTPEERRLVVELPGGFAILRLPGPTAGAAAGGELLGPTPGRRACPTLARSWGRWEPS